MKEVAIYSKSGCGGCEAAKKFMQSNNINYIEFNLDEDIEAKKSLLGKGVQTLPFITIDDQNIHGFNPIEIMAAVNA